MGPGGKRQIMGGNMLGSATTFDKAKAAAKAGDAEAQKQVDSMLAQAQKKRDERQKPKASAPKTREEIKADERRSRFSALRDAPPSNNVVITYRGYQATSDTVIDMGRQIPPKSSKRTTKKELDEQFRYGSQRIQDNQGTNVSGFIRMPNGSIFEIASGTRSAKLVKGDI